jgi:uncharacterized protein (TIGR02466 family)
MNVEIVFPVALLLHDVAPGVREATHAKVLAYLQSEAGKRDVAPSPVEALETSYFATERAVLDDARLDALKGEILSVGDAFVRWLGVDAIPLEFERSWINIFRPGMQEMQHTHDGSLFSGVYYVEAPDNCGDLLFPDPIGARRAHRAFTNTGGTAKQVATEWTYPPKAGRIVMFESWTPHAVLGNKSGKTRISISFNLRRKR